MLRKKKMESTEEIVPQAVYFNSDEKIENENSAEDLSSKKKKPLMEILGLIEKIENSQNMAAGTGEDEIGNQEDNEAGNVNPEPAQTENIPVEYIQPEVEASTEELYQEKMDISEIYHKFGPSTSETNTVYIIDSFIKALPDNLPSDIKLQSVLGIISASKMDISQLLVDGNKRLEVLTQFFRNFMESNNNVIVENEQEIRILTEKINEHKKIIEGRKKLQEEQKSIIEFELQKIENIIDFVQSKKQ